MTLLLLKLLSARWGNEVYRGASENVVLALCFGALIQHGAFCARFYERERIVSYTYCDCYLLLLATHSWSRTRELFQPIISSSHLVLTQGFPAYSAASSSSHRITSLAKESVFGGIILDVEWGGLDMGFRGLLSGEIQLRRNGSIVGVLPHISYSGLVLPNLLYPGRGTKDEQDERKGSG